MSYSRKIFINTIYQIIGKVITSVLGFLGIYFLTRHFSSIEFSEYSSIFNYVGFVAIFADLGLTSLLTRKIALSGRDENTIKYFFSMRLIFLIIFFSIFSIISFLIPYSQSIRTGIIIASFYNSFILLSSIFWSIFQAKLEFKKVVISQIINSFVFIFFVLIGINMNFGLQYFVIANVFASFACYAVTHKLSVLPFNLIKFDINVFKRIVKEVWPFALGAIISVAYFKIDSILLSFYYNPSRYPDVGLYNISYRFFEVAIVFGGFFAQTLYPFFSKQISSKDFTLNFNKYLIYSFFISVVSSVLIFLFSNPLILIFGKGYLDSVSSLRVLSLASGATIFAGFFLSVAIAGKKEILVLKFSAIAFIINIILNLIFIPKYSFMAASWITVVTQFFILVANIIAAVCVVKEKNRC